MNELKTGDIIEKEIKIPFAEPNAIGWSADLYRATLKLHCNLYSEELLNGSVKISDLVNHLNNLMLSVFDPETIRKNFPKSHSESKVN